MPYTISIKEVAEVPSFAKENSPKLRKAHLFGCDLLLASDFPNQKLAVVKENKGTLVKLKFSGEMKIFLSIGDSSFEATVCGDFEDLTYDMKAIPDILEYGADNHVLSLIKDYLGATLLCGLRTIDRVCKFPKD